MERYKIIPAQIYYITRNDARNMIKIVDLFKETLEDNDEENIFNVEDSSYF